MSGATADFALDANGRLILPPRVIAGPEKIAQSVGIRLRTFLGEWFLDLDHGVPYLGGVLGRQRPEMVEQLLRQQVLGVAGVRRITAFSLDIDPRTRRAAVAFAAEVEGGEASGEVPISLRAR